MRGLTQILLIGLALNPLLAGLDHPAVRLREFIEPAPRDPEVHASTLAEVGAGEFVAAWFAGSKEGSVDVSIWSARRTESGWGAASEAVQAQGPAGERVPAYNPVLIATGQGRLALVHSAGWEGKPWLPWLQWSEDGGRHWGAPARLPEGIRGPDRNLSLRLPDGGWLHPSTSAGGVHVEISDARLEHWERRPKLQDPGAFRALQPTLLDHGGGRIQMLCRTYSRELATAWSDDHGRTWTPLEGLGITLANSAIAATRLPDGRFLLVYTPTGKPKNEKDWGPRVPLTVAIAGDGRQWRNVFDLEDQDIREGYAYPCVLVGSDKRVHLTYTWGRKRIRYVVIEPKLL
jgi:predicted neuraminidase